MHRAECGNHRRGEARNREPAHPLTNYPAEGVLLRGGTNPAGAPATRDRGSRAWADRGEPVGRDVRNHEILRRHGNAREPAEHHGLPGVRHRICERSLEQLLGTDVAKRRALLQMRRQIGEHRMESLDLGGKGRQRFRAVAATGEVSAIADLEDASAGDGRPLRAGTSTLS